MSFSLVEAKKLSDVLESEKSKPQLKCPTCRGSGEISKKKLDEIIKIMNNIFENLDELKENNKY